MTRFSGHQGAAVLVIDAQQGLAAQLATADRVAEVLAGVVARARLAGVPVIWLRRRTGAVCRDALFPLEKEDTKLSGKGVWGVDLPRCPLRFLLRRFEKTGETLNSFHNHSQAGWFAKTASPLSTKLHPPSIFHLACLQDLNPV